MSDYIFSDQIMIDEIMQRRNITLGNLYETINRLARYNYIACGLNKKENYDKINAFLKLHCKDYSEVGEYRTIERCITRAKKYKWRNIDTVIITKDELAKIASLNDDRKEKIAFTLLADAKYNKAAGQYDYNISFLSESKIYNLSRVTMPIVDRSMFLSFLYDNELVIRNTNPKFKGKILNYVSDSDQDIGIELHEVDYKELAFTYMNYKYGGYKKCASCGRLIKIKKNTQYCKLCAHKYEPIEIKTIYCIDCGKEVSVDAKANNACRCIDCQHKKQLEYQRISMAKARNVK